MTYADKFVVEVKQNGKILRVKDGAVYLPFGSEYSLYLKNLNTRRASINISIDGEDVLDHSSLILDANSSTELQGFLSGNTAKNRFRFINKTKEISEHRGDREEDGLVRVEFAFEKPEEKPWITDTIKEVHHYYNQPLGEIKHYGSHADWSYTSSSNSSSSDPSYSSKCSPMSLNTRNVTMDSLGVQNVSEVPNSDEGITVKGSEVNQQFQYASVGEVEESHAIVILLKGLTQSGDTVSESVSVRGKLECSSCGTKSNSSFKFCPKCGTFLQ